MAKRKDSTRRTLHVRSGGDVVGKGQTERTLSKLKAMERYVWVLFIR